MAENPGEPLQASVGEQLREKAELEERSAADRQEVERQHAQVERRKAEEQESVLRHTGGERRLRPPRRATAPALPSWAIPAALVGGLWFARRSTWVLLAGAAAALAIWASRAEDRVEAW